MGATVGLRSRTGLLAGRLLAGRLLAGLLVAGVVVAPGPAARADVAVPRPLGFRAVERSQTFSGVAAHPELAFFLWPVLLDDDHCRAAAEPIHEGSTFRVRAGARCERARPRFVYAEPRCARCPQSDRPRPSVGARLFADRAEAATATVAETASVVRDAEGRAIDCARCQADARQDWSPLQPRLMAMPVAAYANLDVASLNADDVPNGAFIATSQMPTPRWVRLDDRVVDEREQVRVEVRDGGLVVVPSSLTTITRDASAQRVDAGADGAYPAVSPRQSDSAPAFRIVVRGLAAHPGWRLYVATQDDQIGDGYVQTHLVEVEEGVEIPIANRHRLPAFVASPRDRGPLPADTFLIVRTTAASSVYVTAEHSDIRTRDVRLGTLLTAYAPPASALGVGAIVDVVELAATDWAATDGGDADDQGPVRARRVEARFVYDHGLETSEAFETETEVFDELIDDEAGGSEADEPEADESAPDAVARRRYGLGALEVGSSALNEAVARVVGPRPDAPLPDPRPTPPPFWWLLGRRVALGALVAAAVVGLLRWRTRRDTSAPRPGGRAAA